MRGLFLLILVTAIAVRTTGAVQAGILGWTWLTLMTPQKLAWGIAMTWPLNYALAIVTLTAWLVSREPKRLPINAATVLWVLFMTLATFTTFFALVPDLAWPMWSRTMKVMILGLLAATVMNSQIRIHSLIWIAVLSLGYFGVKGGVFTILTGGHYHVLPAEASIGDSNDLALALCMILPLMNYLRLQSANRLMRIGSILGMSFTALGVLGTYSRGGLIGLTIMGGYLWWQSKSRFTIALVALIIIFPAYRFMPVSWIERMSTIQTAEADASFQDRLGAWRTEFNMAKSRPLIGGGFNAILHPPVYQQFNDNPSFTGARAAHSIYFEVLGDHGFVGLALYVALLLATWRYAGTTRRKARHNPEQAWIADLAAMIQVSLVAFAVAGAGLSMAYYDLLYLLISVTVALRKLVQQSHVQLEGETSSTIPALVAP